MLKFFNELIAVITQNALQVILETKPTHKHLSTLLMLRSLHPIEVLGITTKKTKKKKKPRPGTNVTSLV